MKFNYQSEKRKFDERWKEVERECRKAGMSDSAIKELLEYDLTEFRRERIFCLHNQYINDYEFDDGYESDENKNPYLKNYAEQFTREDMYFSNDRYGWIQQLDDEELISKVLELGEERIELLTQYVFEEYTQKELADSYGIKQSSVANRIDVIRKKLKK